MYPAIENSPSHSPIIIDAQDVVMTTPEAVKTSAAAPALGNRGSKHAPNPNLEAMLEQTKKDATDLALNYITLSMDDPSRPTKKEELVFAEEMINTLIKALSWQEDRSNALLDARLVAQVPRFQIANLKERNRHHPVFPTTQLFSRRLVPVERFSEKPSAMMAAKELFHMKMRPDRETVPAFALRFQTSMRDAQLEDGPELAMLCLLLSLGLCMLSSLRLTSGAFVSATKR